MYEKLLKECQRAEDKFIDEGLKSKKLAQLAQSSGDKELLPKIYKKTDLQLDKIPDESVKYADLDAARGAKPDDDWAANRALSAAEIETYRDLVFWVLKKEKKSPSGQILKPGLLAVTDGDVVLSGETFGKPARGMGYSDRLLAFADEVYAINVRQLSRGKYDQDTHKQVGALSAEDLKRKREDQKSGAVALIPPEKFAQWNKERYAEIIAKKNPSPELKGVAEELNAITKKAIESMDVSKMEGGKARVPGYKDKRDRSVSIKAFLSYVEKVWEKLNYAQDYWAEFKQLSPEEQKKYEDQKWGPMGSYKQYLEEAKKTLEEIKSGILDVYWSD